MTANEFYFILSEGIAHLLNQSKIIDTSPLTPLDDHEVMAEKHRHPYEATRS